MFLIKSDASYADLDLLVNSYILVSNRDELVTIESVYRLFKVEWVEEVVLLLHANKDSYELEEWDFENIEERLDVFGFKVPSFEMVHGWFDALQLAHYTSNKDMIHSAVVNVW